MQNDNSGFFIMIADPANKNMGTAILVIDINPIACNSADLSKSSSVTVLSET